MIRLNVKFFGFVAYLALLIHFPFRALIEYNQALGSLPLFYVSIFVHPLVFILLPWFVLNFKRLNKLQTLWISLIFVFLLLAFIRVFYDNLSAYTKTDSGGINVKDFHLSLLYFYLAIFVIGSSIEEIDRKRKFALLVYVAFIVNLAFNFNTQSFSLDLTELGNERAGIYLFIGDSFVILSLLLISSSKSDFERNFIAWMSFAISFLLYSRTSFYGYASIIPFILYRDSSGQVVRISRVLLNVLFVGLFFSAWLVTRPDIDMYRMLVAFSGYEDYSLSERAYVWEIGFDGVLKSWFLGDFGGQVRDFGRVGLYIHNLFSFWQAFGLLPFLLIFGLIIWGVWVSFAYLIRSRSRDSLVEFSAYVFIFCAITFAASRSYTHIHLWLAFGLAVNLLRSVSPLRYSNESKGVF